MLERVLEPEVMDTAEEARHYDSMDHSQVNKQFVADLLATGSYGHDILDLGTGTAQIPIELCKQHEECRVMAVDLSIEMLELARFNIDIADLMHRIQLDHVDSKDLPHADDMFDTVISNSIIHHIPDPEVVIREAIRVTRPGGLIFFRDLARPDNLATLNELVNTYAGDENEAQKKMFAESLHAALTLEEMQTFVEKLGMNPDEVSMTTDRHWTWCGHKPK